MPDRLNFNTYDTEAFFDELFDENGRPRDAARILVYRINALPDYELQCRQDAIERALMRMGITFAVYGDQQGTEKIFPFDIVPRIISAIEWAHIEAGLKQRIRALNKFVDDVYHDQEIINDGVVPRELLEDAASYRPQCHGLNPPLGVWCHVTGTDLILHNDVAIYVLEDNLRCPSGVSYVLQNRQVMKRSFPQVFAEMQVRPVIDYPIRLYETLRSLAPETSDPTVVVLTPWMYNSAYY